MVKATYLNPPWARFDHVIRNKVVPPVPLFT